MGGMGPVFIKFGKYRTPVCTAGWRPVFTKFGKYLLSWPGYGTKKQRIDQGPVQAGSRCLPNLVNTPPPMGGMGAGIYQLW